MIGPGDIAWHRAQRGAIAAGGAAAVSALVFGLLAWRDSRRVRAAENVSFAAVGGVFQAPPIEPVARETSGWPAPLAQARGRDWIYDVFTPPEIYYHTRTRQFAVRPPGVFATPESAPPAAFGLELIAVEPEPFRVQLIGYVGADGDWRGTFENRVTGEIVVARAGFEFAGLDLTLQNFDVRRQPIAVADSMTTLQRVAIATVRDRRSGREITLTSREEAPGDMLYAVVAIANEPATRELRTGAVVAAGAVTYRIDEIRASPPQMVVTKVASGVAEERRTLSARARIATSRGTTGGP